MRSVIVAVLLLAYLCEAAPWKRPGGRLGIDNRIVGGQDADPGEWPWQLVLQRSGSYVCEASLLSTTKALTAAHCVDGSIVSSLTVVAGLHLLSDESQAQLSAVASYTMHENYGGSASPFSNDIAIINLASAFTLDETVALLALPPDNSNDFVGASCMITGWGFTGSNSSSDVLQEAPISPIGTAECNDHVLGGVSDADLCVYDPAHEIGLCGGNSGSPCNCPDEADGWYVAGVATWSLPYSSDDSCLQMPSIYIRTSAYLQWIESN